MALRRSKLSAMRRIIGKNLRESVNNYPQVPSFAQVDVTDLLRMKNELHAEGKPVTFGAMLVKATAITLQEHPDLNCYLDGDELVSSDEVHVGVAMQGERGLYVPVVRNAQAKNVGEITEDMRALARKIRENKLEHDDLVGGTITISSDGTGRTEFMAPILNQGQCLLVGAGRTKKHLLVMDDGSVAIRDMVWVVFTMNHVLTDGIHVSRFTDRLCEVLEAPYEYLKF